ncbi:uncharacterized protein OE_5230R (plasmid) [Halobacterium salinarum R1]|uniref:ABC-2 type transport system permease protein n=6 Tax=Halobacterium salinarum TaxID=2242 RepID=A0A510NB50_HALSA|nr:hypothetical protein [Halobacterium salinarum]QCC46084.1 uncharacterized protein HBSAL_12560 [Halobacterium salinarum]CAP15576.2 uncharacterized protein OE_5230R [Halobacterium salinarum R1]DAC79923.1 TPA_inf: uncharacterized protein VNG_6327H [Halobacterium salinarum NRC-1]
MNVRSWLRHALQIARIERTRNKRQPGHSATWRALRMITLIVLSIGGGTGAYLIGKLIARGDFTLPVSAIQTAAVAGFITFLSLGIQRTSSVNERLDTGYLLTTVGAHEAALGLVFTVYRQVAVPVFLPALAVAVGLALGSQTPATAVTVGVAVVGFVTLAALLGVVLSLATKLATSRSPRLRRYKNYTYVLTFILGFLIWITILQGPLSNQGACDWLQVVPPGWFVDLALFGLTDVPTEPARGLSALGVTVVGFPVLMGTTIALTERVWTADRVSGSVLHRSRSLVGTGLAEWLFAGWVSRPVLTVARKRWLQERRVPIGLLFQGYLLMLAPLVFLPIFAAGEVPGVALVGLVFLSAVGTALAFGAELVGTEYASLPMTLTSVSGRHFIRGTVFAGITISGPFTLLVVLLLGLGSPLVGVELLVLGVVGIVLIACSVVVSAMLGLDAPYYAIRAEAIPFTDITAYTESGGVFKWGKVFAVVGLVCIPAYMVYGARFVGGPVATALGASMPVVRIGALIVTSLFAIAVAALAYRRAVARFNEYTLP